VAPLSEVDDSILMKCSLSWDGFYRRSTGLQEFSNEVG
jgi:hypothetical protein